MLQHYQRGTLEKLSGEEFDAYESTIDTKYFGVSSAKVLLNKACLVDQRQNELLRFLQNFEFIVIINKANDSSNNHWLGEKTKAFLTDMNIQFSKKVSITKECDNDFTRVADNFPESEQVVKIAETSFNSSRFLNDPYLPVEKARGIYADIVKNAFRKQGRFFITFQRLERIIGFLLFSVDQTISFSTIELVAIHQDFRGTGVGRSLICAMEHHMAKMKVETIIVGTQLTNFNALKFYTSYGFSYFQCNSIYHYWPLKS